MSFPMSCGSLMFADPGLVVTILLLKLQVRAPVEHHLQGVLSDENDLFTELEWR